MFQFQLSEALLILYFYVLQMKKAISLYLFPVKKSEKVKKIGHVWLKVTLRKIWVHQNNVSKVKPIQSIILEPCP